MKTQKITSLMGSNSTTCSGSGSGWRFVIVWADELLIKIKPNSKQAKCTEFMVISLMFKSVKCFQVVYIEMQVANCLTQRTCGGMVAGMSAGRQLLYLACGAATTFATRSAHALPTSTTGSIPVHTSALEGASSTLSLCKSNTLS